MYFDVDIQEKFENTKGVARSRKSKRYRPNNDQSKKDRQTTVYKAVHITLAIEQHEPHSSICDVRRNW